MIEQTEMHAMHGVQTNGKSCEATLVWRNVNVYIKDKSKRGKNRPKQIINSSTGCIKAGTLMAVMGSRCVILCISSENFLFEVYPFNCMNFYLFNSSGAGKSTLMSTLAFRNMSKFLLIQRAIMLI